MIKINNANAKKKTVDINIPNLEDHIRFICPECGKALPSQLLWRKHLNFVHEYSQKSVEVFNFTEINERYHECNECHKWVANGKQSITTLQYHRISHLPFSLTFKCRYCIQAFPRKRALCDHLISNHGKMIHAQSFLGATKDKPFSPSKKTTPIPLASVINKQKPATYQGGTVSLLKRQPKSTAEPVNQRRGSGGDILQQALQDSFLDLETDALDEYTQSGRAVTDESLNQSLSDLEDILKKDLSQNTVKQNKGTIYTLPQPITVRALSPLSDSFSEGSDLELDDEQWEELISEYAMPVKDAPAATVKTSAGNLAPRSNNSAAAIKRNVSTPESSAAGSSGNVNKNKRLKLDLNTKDKPELEEKIKKMLETYMVYLCPECGRDFNDQFVWREHVLHKHNLISTTRAKFKSSDDGKTHKCRDCGLVLKTDKARELQCHRFTHMPFNHYLKCTFCQKTRSSKPKMIQHIRDFHANSVDTTKAKARVPPIKMSVTANAALRCSECNKLFTSREVMEKHQKQCALLKPPNIKLKYTLDIERNKRLHLQMKKLGAHIREVIRKDLPHSGD